MLVRATLESLYQRLYATYGPQYWWPGESPFEIMVGAVLIQRTAWRNAAQALTRLRAVGLLAPAPLAAVAQGVLEDCVRPAGFYRQKSTRLRALASWIEDRGGMSAVAELDDRALRAQLLGVPGIGPETADAIALYAFERAVFVVDAYLRRVFARLGLIVGDEAYEDLRRALHANLNGAAPLYNEFHALLVAHGQRHCRARPRCEDCVLRASCAHGAGTLLH